MIQLSTIRKSSMNPMKYYNILEHQEEIEGRVLSQICNTKGPRIRIWGRGGNKEKRVRHKGGIHQNRNVVTEFMSGIRLLRFYISKSRLKWELGVLIWRSTVGLKGYQGLPQRTKYYGLYLHTRKKTKSVVVEVFTCVRSRGSIELRRERECGVYDGWVVV